MTHDTIPARDATATTPAQAPDQARDDGALRLGGLSPLFPPAAVADPGRLRMGGLSPLFGRD
ncbi:hypothetical protein GXW74_21205 [Roseomonas eburnea]|uniref:Uncharacterized protein n=1 Tax=Neoroseomonas eburnea TaxID=1346889 RepID=A0A9X9XH38_9PROT|nr:hypothetical protein [Neoroseomonas eburnea]MBR0683024.1 hypothetical protein [Neoroseomonas eburnea]